MSVLDWQNQKASFVAIFIVLGFVFGGCLGLAAVLYLLTAHPGELIPILIGAAAAFGLMLGVPLICFFLVKRKNPKLAVAALRRVLFEAEL